LIYINTLTRPPLHKGPSHKEGSSMISSSPDVASNRPCADAHARDAGSREADRLIAENLRKDYERLPTLASFAIKTTVRNGHVTLRGRVDHEFQRATAERVARVSSGVDRVTNRIVVERDAMAGL
jgi:osmotically-inducible protein OsmY